MKPKFANFKFYQKIVFKSCSLFKMHENVSVYSQNTEKRLLWAVSLLFYAHFIKPRCIVWHCNTYVAFNVHLIAVLRLDYCYRRKTGFTQVWRYKNTDSFTACKWKFRSSLYPEWNEWIRVVYAFQSKVRRKIDKLFSFQRCKPLRHICIINKRISYPIVLLHVFRKIFLKMRD